MTVTIPDWVWYLLLAVVFAFLLWFGWAMARITADSDRRIAQMAFEPDTSADIDVAIFNVTDDGADCHCDPRTCGTCRAIALDAADSVVRPALRSVQ